MSRLSMGIAAWLTVAAAHAAAAGVPSGATVVVLTGLPGDVESERAYDDQVRRLLKVLATPDARPARLFVLVDSPEGLRLPEGLVGAVGAGSREGLLSLAREVTAQPGPLVVLIWGHGGPQGTKPVFHVRGPRLDAADVAAFAAAAGDRPSRWVLYFPGSGAFAEALTRPGREILASEHQVAFRSDPVGMELLIEAWRADPELSFAALAERVGRETVAWYETQRLARTEEPTYWSGASARRLAAAEPGMTAASAPSPPPTPPRSPEWEGITPVAANAFPGADAVVLRRSQRYTLGESPALVQEVDEFVQVLTEEGESRGDVSIAFSPPDERVVLLDCEVLRPDGMLLRHDPGAAASAPAGASESEYRAPQLRHFSLPGVAPGAILRLHYRSEWRRFPLPHVFLEVPLAADVPILAFRLEVRVGSATPLHFAASGVGAPEPAVRETSYGRVYAWHLEDQPAVIDEALAPIGRGPRLLLSTFPDWASFAGWYGRLIQLADQVTPEIDATATELVRGRTSERDRVVALYEFVTGLRYVAVPIGVNSHRPHAAANVLKNRYGDCKDKANLFNTLLRTQGITAHLALVPRFGEAHEAVPGLGFNHAISRVRVDGEWVWADTTDEFARFGLLPPGDPGRKVLVIDGRSRGLVSLPSPHVSEHRLALQGSVAAEEDAVATLSAEAHGFPDYALRQSARAAAGHGATRPILAEGFRPAAGGFTLRSQAHTPVSALDRDFEWRAEGTWTGLVSSLGDGGRLLRAPFWLPAEWDAAGHARRAPLFLNQGYPLLLEESFEVELPKGGGEVRLPAARSGEEDPLLYRVEWSRSGPDRLAARLRVELAAGELTQEQTRSFQAQLRSLSAALAQGAVHVSPTR